ITTILMNRLCIGSRIKWAFPKLKQHANAVRLPFVSGREARMTFSKHGYCWLQTRQEEKLGTIYDFPLFTHSSVFKIFTQEEST
ncbi:hypothetical protein QWY20_16450, partial [Alkalimonas sp. MEB108]